jgi:hypothetical protein
MFSNSVVEKNLLAVQNAKTIRNALNTLEEFKAPLLDRAVLVIPSSTILEI